MEPLHGRMIPEEETGQQGVEREVSVSPVFVIAWLEIRLDSRGESVQHL